MSNIILGDTGLDNVDADHGHRFGIHPHGDGNTDIVNNHLHIIIDGEVLPAGDDNHTHPDVDFPLKGKEDKIF